MTKLLSCKVKFKPGDLIHGSCFCGLILEIHNTEYPFPRYSIKWILPKDIKYLTNNIGDYSVAVIDETYEKIN